MLGVFCPLSLSACARRPRFKRAADAMSVVESIYLSVSLCVSAWVSVAVFGVKSWTLCAWSLVLFRCPSIPWEFSALRIVIYIRWSIQSILIIPRNSMKSILWQKHSIASEYFKYKKVRDFYFKHTETHTGRHAHRGTHGDRQIDKVHGRDCIYPSFKTRSSGTRGQRERAKDARHKRHQTKHKRTRHKKWITK